MSRHGWLALSLSLLLAAAAPVRAEERVEAADTNQDGKPDEWKIYDGQTLVRVERDRDGDGKREVRIILETVEVLPPEGGPPRRQQRAIRSEVDRNGDGKPDLVRWMKEGQPDRERGDVNLDGRPDLWSYYRKGTKELTIMDKNHDGRPDAWFYYDPTGVRLSGGRVDENFDGTPDRTFGKVPEREDRQPW